MKTRIKNMSESELNLYIQNNPLTTVKCPKCGYSEEVNTEKLIKDTGAMTCPKCKEYLIVK